VRRIETALARLHERTPLACAIPRERLLNECGSQSAVLAAVLDRIAADERSPVVARDGGFALRAFAPVLSAAQERLRNDVIEAYRLAAFSPPDPDELARSVGVNGEALRPIIELCESESHLARVEGAIYLHREWADELRRRVCGRLEGSAEGMTVSEIRDLLDTTRKHAVPICEHLDRIGLTRRVGDRRVLARRGGK
jgi:selenocysteine-specific elongation factor